jgi:hypothetical protein
LKQTPPRKRFSTAPTPEREARAGEKPRIIRTIPHAGNSSPRAHRFDPPLDRASRILTADQYAAAEKLRWAATGKSGRPKTQDMNGAARASNPSQRLGITETQQQAARIFNFFWPRIPRDLKASTRVLVLQEPVDPGMETVPTPEEWGKRWGGTRDPRRAAGVSDGLLKAICGVLVEINLAYRTWRKREREIATSAKVQRIHGAKADTARAEQPYVSIYDKRYDTEDRR